MFIGLGVFVVFSLNSPHRATHNAHAQQCPCTRIAKLRFLENDCACGVTLASKVSLLARNRVMGGRWAATKCLIC
jgi:hypothetical protein